MSESRLTREEIIKNLPFDDFLPEDLANEDVDDVISEVPKTPIKQPSKSSPQKQKPDTEEKRPSVQLHEKALTNEVAILTPFDDDVTSLKFSAEFEKNLAEIRPTLEKLSALQKINVTEVDDDDLSKTLQALSEAQGMKKQIDESRKILRQHFDSVRDENLTYFDNRLSEAGYDELVEADKDIKQLKKDVLAHRINERWAELKETFDSCLDLYPIIADYSQTLTDYSKFRIRHKDMVTGAKKAPITERHRTAVRQIMYSISENLVYISENSHGLNDMYFKQWLHAYENADSMQIVDSDWVIAQESLFYDKQLNELQNGHTPSSTIKQASTTLRAETKQYEKALEEQRKQLQEGQPQNLEGRQERPHFKPSLLLNPNARKNTPNSFSQGFQRPKQPSINRNVQQPSNATKTTNLNMVLENAPEKYKWVIDFIMNAQNGKFQDVMTNPKTKIQLLYTMWVSFNDSQSIFVRMTNNDPEEVLALSEYIHSL